MHKGYLKTTALLGALSVMLGAFAAHGLKNVASPDDIRIFQLGVQYQFYHVFALLAVGILYGTFRKNTLRWAGIFFILGIIFFSGSLYLMTWMKISGFSEIKWIGPITPLGGTCFIAGWILLFVSLARPKN